MDLHSKIVERFDKLTTCEMQDVVNLIEKGELEDAWIMLGMSPKDFAEQKEERRRARLKNTIVSELFNKL